MIVKSCDLSYGYNALYSLNIISGGLEKLDAGDGRKPDKIVVSIPSLECTFRTYEVHDGVLKDKSADFVRSRLMMDLNINLDEIVFDFFHKGKQIFVVIAKKGYVEGLLKEFGKDVIVDAEGMAILRGVIYAGHSSGCIYYYGDSYIINIIFENNFPVQIRILNCSENLNLRDNDILAGKIPEDLDTSKSLLTWGESAGFIDDNIVSRGGALHYLFDERINLNKGYESDDKIFVRFTAVIMMVFLMAIAALIVKRYVLMDKVRLMDKEISGYYTSVFPGEKAVDPVAQFKGKSKSMKEGNNEKILIFLAYVGKEKKICSVAQINKISIIGTDVMIEGRSRSLSEIESFNSKLSLKGNTRVEETVKEPNGILRFKIVGRLI